MSDDGVECFEHYGAFYDSLSERWVIYAEDEALVSYDWRCKEIKDRVDLCSKECLAAESFMLSIMLRNLWSLEPHLRRFVENLLIKA